MTAPSLLDELEGVVHRITDDVDEVRRTGGDPERERHTQRIAANFIRTHHDVIAAMAKRLEAAERDAARWRHARKLLTVDDIEGAQGSYDSFGRLVSEDECKRADDAIDAAAREGEG